jgi:Restriction endonuclease
MVDRSAGRSCFITVPVDTDVAPVTRSLVSRGVECTRPDRFDWSTTLENITDLIREADFVCAYSPTTLPPNVMFEIGIAVGQGKPIFMVIGKNLPLPADLRSISFVSADRWIPDIIEPHLDAFLETLPKKNLQGLPVKKKPKGRFNFSRERDRLAHIVGASSPREFELFVAGLFRKAGINVTPSPFEDFGADLALSSPEIKRKFGNPILVEIKHSRLSPDPSFIANRLARLIASGRGSAALLVTADPMPPVFEDFTSAAGKRVPIYSFSIQQLIDNLETGGFIDEIWDRQRKAGHKN